MEDNKTMESVESFSLEEAWDDEATRHGYDDELLAALLSLSLVSAVAGSLKATKGLLQVGRGFWLEKPGRGAGLARPLLVCWGQLLAGLLGYARTESGWSFYRPAPGGWVEAELGGELGSDGLDGRGFQQAAWLASKLKAGKRLDATAFSLGGKCWRAVSKAGWESLEEAEPEGEPLTVVEAPDDAAERLQLLAEAWGSEQTDFMSGVSFYLAAPLTPRFFFLLSDAGGTGKSSWEQAFAAAFPGACSLGLDATNLAAGGFTGGAALAPLLGKRVAFADESGSLGDRELSAIAGLSTGGWKQVRFGGGRFTTARFALKLVFASNQASAFTPMEAVGRRKVEVPQLGFRPASWWREAAGKQWPGQSRWEVCFSKETVFALVSRGWELWQQWKGEWPSTAGKSFLRLSPELEEALRQPEATRGPLAGFKPSASGLLPVRGSEWPSKQLPASTRKRLKAEALAKLSLTTKPGVLKGEMARWLCVSEPARWEQLQAMLFEGVEEAKAEEARQREAKQAVEDPDLW